MKQNSIKMYAQVLCCALAVCSTSDFACGMNVMDAKQEKVKDISAETAVSCLQDIDKAITILRNISYRTPTREELSAEFEAIGICRENLRFNSEEQAASLAYTDIFNMSEGRVEILVAYLRNKLGSSIPFMKDELPDAEQYKFDYHSKRWSEYSNKEICLAFLNIANYIFCGITEYRNFYFSKYAPDQTRDEELRRSNVWEIWEKWENVCDEVYWSVWCDC